MSDCKINRHDRCLGEDENGFPCGCATCDSLDGD